MDRRHETPNDRPPIADRASLVARFCAVRAATERLAAPLSAEDQGLQSMPCCSPTKWHRAHTTWFFETFLLGPRGVAPYDARWGALFNSYYVAAGPRHPRPRRGMLSRPSVDEVAAYRRAVDDRVVALLERADDALLAEVAPIVELGVAHEEQHQELLLTDILNALHESPLRPAYRSRVAARSTATVPATSYGERTRLRYFAYDGGVVEIGARSRAFHFDNEAPRHRALVEPFEMADRLVTVGEWKAFANDGGYASPSLWLSDGWEWRASHDVRAPLYAEHDGGALVVFGLDGVREARDDEPLAHASYYEADAIARFLGARLPTEAEWEIAATPARVDGNFVEDGALRPLAANRGDAPSQLFGDAWEWTQSAYAPYPGFVAPRGALGEYNGKFMVNQLVLRGGSCFTPRAHVRATYRNFWHPDTRFQMTGVRLARSVRP